MIKLETEFQLVQFSDLELKEATTFSPVQRAYFQNLLGEVAHRKINLKVDPIKFHDFIQEEAYLTAQIDLLRSLLNPAMQSN